MIEQRPATRNDYEALLVGLGIETPPARWRVVPLQIAHGRSWAIYADRAPPIALIGILHTSRESEAWFLSGRGSERHMLPLARLFRRQLQQDRRLMDREIVAAVSPHNAAGQRLARCSGLVPTGTFEGGVEIWTTTEGHHGRRYEVCTQDRGRLVRHEP